MGAKPVTIETVREIGRALPGVEESTVYGSPALKARGKLLACVPVNRSAEPDSLAVRIGIEQRAALLAEAPETYYLTEHYAGHPMVLVRLARIDAEQLRDLLRAALRFAGVAHRRTVR